MPQHSRAPHVNRKTRAATFAFVLLRAVSSGRIESWRSVATVEPVRRSSSRTLQDFIGWKDSA
jgi:hypothetical protein